ncbi:MAG: iron-containing alcohol dehydrogenase, partial [Gemmataceae bacterium]
TKHVELGLQRARECRPDGILAVGGGSSMDCAKGINFLYSNGGKMQDYKGYGRASQPMLPSVGVPTTAGTGSESQCYALIADDKTHLKMACGDRKAAFQVCLLDPELTVSLPASITAISGLDAITHAIESYVCLRRNPVSQIFSLEAWRLLNQSFEHVLRSPEKVDFRGQMQLGASWAGLAIENSMLGAAHACANPITAHYGLVHGLAVAILLPHVIRFNSQKVGHLYSDLVQGHQNSGMDPAQASEYLANRILVFLEMAGLPVTLRDCGVSKEILFILAEEASQQWTGKFNPVPVSEDDLLSLYQSAF